MLHSIGLVESDLCQRCFGASGTYLHRHWQCDSVRSLLEQFGLSTELQRLVRDQNPSAMKTTLLERALLPDPRQFAPLPLLERLLVWDVQPDLGVLAGEVCIDASGSHPTDALLNRVGWGAATVNVAGAVTGAVHGNLPSMLQEVGAGEIYAAAAVLPFCLPPVVLVTDYQGFHDGFHAGPSATTAPGREYADVWRCFWRAVAEFGQEHIRVVKVKAHLSRSAVQMGDHDITFQQWAGNVEADTQAKKGALLHGVAENICKRAAIADETVRQCAVWMGWSAARRHASKTPSDVSTRPPAPDLCLGGGGRSHAQTGQARSMEEHAAALSTHSAVAAERSAAARPCRLVVCGENAHPSHRLWSVGQIVGCTRCGAYSAERKSRLLTAACRQGGAGRHAMACARRLLKGQHPGSGVFLGQPRPCWPT